jgi:thioredoxin reductase (NADPH)
MESQLCGDGEVIVIGGGNSAGQAAVFLAETARKVYMLVRGKTLSETMSRYLTQRITTHPVIELHLEAELQSLEGDSHLERVAWLDRSSGERTTRDIRHVFVMAGASPHSDWLRGCVAMDQQGFILTGRDLDPVLESAPRKWPLERAPEMLETSLPAVYAVGDIRSGNVKRVASAVGEGSISIHLVHRALAEIQPRKYSVDENEIQLAVAIEPVDGHLSVLADLNNVAIGITHVTAPFPAVGIE